VIGLVLHRKSSCGAALGWLNATVPSQPTAADVQVLTRLRAGEGGFRTIVFPDAGHGLLDVPASDPDALPTFVRWISRTVEAQR
jgi:hypothetical protein